MGNADATKLATGSALLVCPDPAKMGELGPLLGQMLPLTAMLPVQAYPSAAGLSELVAAHGPGLCFVDVETDREAALRLISQLAEVDRNIQIVVLLSGNDPDLILRCLRQGATEFLLQPFTVEDLRPVLDRLASMSRHQAGPGKGAKVFCVSPVKGACGASTIASNLAYQWKRLGSKKILLADLDPMTGVISFLLKLKSNYSFLDAVTRSGTLDEDLWRGIVTPCQGVDVLLAPENPTDGLHEMHDPSSILEFARQLYETVIVDTGGAYGSWDLALAKACDELLLVTTNELPALQAAQRVLGYLDRNRVDRSKIRLVVNRYSREVGLSQDAIGTALHTDVFQIIASDYEAVQRALMEGKPIPASSSFGRNLTTLADRLAGRETEVAVKKSTSLAGVFASLFSRAPS